MPYLTTKQTAIVNNLVKLSYKSPDLFLFVYNAVFIECETLFTFDEVERISMFYGWA